LHSQSILHHHDPNTFTTILSRVLTIVMKRRAPCGTRRTHPATNHNDFSLQLEMLSAVASRNHFSRF